MKLLSIVVPSYNQGAYIRETLDSILSQDYRPIEVLVLDGASTDDTVDVLKSYDAPELRWWSERDRGVVDAVNKGLALARGEIVAIQSSDDVYAPGALRAAVEAFAANRGAALVYGDVEYIDASSRASGRSNLPPFDLAEYLGKLAYILQPAAFFTAAAAREVGGWREEISYAADAEFYLRIAARHRVIKIDRVVARYRYHEEQRDKASERVLRDWIAAVEPWAGGDDRRLRRHARSGVDLVRVRYSRPEQWPLRLRAIAHATLVNPALLGNAVFRAAAADVVRSSVFGAGSRIKRRLFPRREEP
jgi:glycosyltransferase involved in cell wall biosynthesis